MEVIIEEQVPVLRFPEFEGEWEVKKFSELAQFKNGLNFSNENEGKGLKIIGVSNFKNHFSIKYDELDEISGFDDIDKSYLLEEGDIVFVRSNGSRALVGRALFICSLGENERVTHSGFTIRARIKVEKILPIFIALQFQTDKIRSSLLLESGGTNISNLSQSILGNLQLYIPSLSEQKKTASFLTEIDKKAEQLTRKKSLLEQ